MINIFYYNITIDFNDLFQKLPFIVGHCWITIAADAKQIL